MRSRDFSKQQLSESKEQNVEEPHEVPNTDVQLNN